jgi:branched-chain amino acid transport system substrate-binding protein
MLALIDIRSGSFEEGFKVRVSVAHDGKAAFQHFEKILPPGANIPEVYAEWRECYHSIASIRAICVPSAQTVEIRSLEEVQQAAKRKARQLKDRLRQWFTEEAFQTLAAGISREIPQNEYLRVIFQASEDYYQSQSWDILQRLPWHLWSLFNNPNVEMAISARTTSNSSTALSVPVKILAVLGDSTGIDVQADKSALESLPYAKPIFLEQRDREALTSSLRNEFWDILFFAGHSTGSSQDGSAFQINPGEQLSIDDLTFSLRRAVNNGLKLAIFNSCDGLGLAKQLAELGIPQIIVMREPIPDEIAQKFLKEFLKEFSKGTSFYLAVRQAREALEGQETQFPGATWLPIIFQNPSAAEFVYPKASILVKLCTGVNQSIKRLFGWFATAIHRVKQILGNFFFYVALATLVLLAIFIIDKFSDSIPRLSPPSLTQSQASFPNIDAHLSLGDKWLGGKPQGWEGTDKGKGILAMKEPNKAIDSFRSSLSKNPNDPEAWIYLNNAIANSHSADDALQIAVTVSLYKAQDSSDAEREKVNKSINDNNETLRGAAIAQTLFNCIKADGASEAVSNRIDEFITALQGEDGNEFIKRCSGQTLGGKSRRLKIQIADDELQIENNDRKKEFVREVAKALSRSANVAIVGHSFSSSTEEAIKVYNEQRIVSISPLSTSVNLNQPPESYFFRTPTSDAVAGEMLANYATNQSLKKVTAFYDFTDTSYATSLVREFEKTFLKDRNWFDTAINSLLPESNPVSRCDWSQTAVSCDNLSRDSSDEAMLLIPSNEQIEKEIKLIKEKGKVGVLGGDTMYREDVKNIAEGTVIAIPWHRHKEKERTDFEKISSLLVDTGNVSWRTAMTYDAVQAIVQGLKNIDLSDDFPTIRKGLQKVLSNDFKADGVEGLGSIKFDSHHNRIPQKGIGVLVEVKKLQENPGTYDFVALPPEDYAEDTETK